MIPRDKKIIKKDIEKVEEIIKNLKDYSKEHPKDLNLQLEIKSFEIRLKEIYRELLISESLKNLEHATSNNKDQHEILKEILNQTEYSKPFKPKSPAVRELIIKYENGKF
jgi:DNA-binding transcriptional regulator GbsR (MarR family)